MKMPLKSCIIQFHKTIHVNINMNITLVNQYHSSPYQCPEIFLKMKINNKANKSVRFRAKPTKCVSNTIVLI